MAELPFLGDDLAVAAVALTGVGPEGVHTLALPLARVLFALVHICEEIKEDRDRETEKQTEREEFCCDITLQFHFTTGVCKLSKPRLWSSSTAQAFLSDGPEPSRADRAEALAKALAVRQEITAPWQLFGWPVRCCQASQSRST